MTRLNRITEGLWKGGSRLGMVALVIAAVLVGFFLRGAFHTESSTSTAPAAETDAGAHLWTCSMHPNVRLPNPGKCPYCGMDLIPLTEDTSDEGATLRTFTTSESAKALMNIETAPVERRFVTTEVRMVGKVDFDETRLAYITAWIPGRLDRLYVDYTGVTVAKGDHMVYMYSPEILTAQEELRRAARAVETMRAEAPDVLKQTAQSTLEAARNKLRRWGLTDEQIEEAEKRGTVSDHITIYAPIGGTVIERMGREGMYVETGSTIYTIVDLSEVWVMLEAYESDLPWIHYGQTVEFTTEAYPGQTFQGKIAFIDPVLNDMTRTVKVRVNVANPGGKLKPDMFVRAVVRAQIATGGRVMDPGLAGKWISPMHPQIVKDGPGACDICGMPLVKAEDLGYVPATARPEDMPLVIPASAPLITGKRAVVYVQLAGAEKPTFEGREIVLGARAGDFYIVRSGLEAGELVVTRGNFNIDSALQILAKPSMMTPEGGGGGSEHQHGSAQPASGGPMEMASALPLASQDQVGEVLAAYDAAAHAVKSKESLTLRDALSTLSDAIAAVDSSAMPGDAQKVWIEYSMRLKNDAMELSDAATERDRARALEKMSGTIDHLRARLGLHAEHARMEPAPAGFRAQFGALLESYEGVHHALAQDDTARAHESAQAASKRLGELDAGQLEGAARTEWDSVILPALRDASEKLANAADLETQRGAFKPYSDALELAFRQLGTPDGLTVYIIHCPMAFNNAGANWIQRDETVANPYFGQAMLKCGEATGRIDPPSGGEAPKEPAVSHEGHAHG